MKRIIISVLSICMTIGAMAQTGTWSGSLEVQGIQLAIVFHLDGEAPTMDSPDQGAKGIPIEVEKGPFGKLTVRIPSLAATYEAQWTINRIVGSFRQMNIELPLTLSPGVPELNRPQTPSGPYPYTTEEVSFSNGDAILKGTLTLPEGWNQTTPALIMVTGSGLQDRNEEIYEHKPFAVIADAFAKAGIATLRYDDRGFGESVGDVANASVEDFKNDALAGLRLLRNRFDRVGVLGHSEGGTIALMLAASQDADFIISLAGMVISGKETLLMQNRTALVDGGIREETAESYCRLLSEAFDAAAGGTPLPDAGNRDIPAALKQNYNAVAMQLNMPYLQNFIALDIRTQLHKISCPVLAFNGTKDIQIDHTANLGALREGLPENANNVIMEAEGLNHLFQHCTTGSTSEYKLIEETFAPKVLEVMTAWINGSK